MNKESQNSITNGSRRRLFVSAGAVLCTSLQTACMHAPTKLLTNAPAKVGSVRIWSFAGNDPAMRGVGAERVKDTLIHNGLVVPSWIELSQAWSAIASLASAWESLPAAPGLHHALVFTYLGRGGIHNSEFNRYEIVLWDAKKRSLIWQGKLGSALNVRGGNLERRSDQIAGDTLRSLRRDGLWAKDDDTEPVNPQGEVIADSVFPQGTMF
jgi:hypothetical protein